MQKLKRTASPPSAAGLWPAGSLSSLSSCAAAAAELSAGEAAPSSRCSSERCSGLSEHLVDTDSDDDQHNLTLIESRCG